MAFAASSNNAGRMRCPPPSRRYPAISVIESTSEAEERANSCSTAIRSSWSRSNTSFAVVIAAVLKFRSVLVMDAVASVSTRAPISSTIFVASPRPGLIRPVVRELQINPEVVFLQQCNHILQRVPILAADAHGVRLDGRLSFALRLLDQFDDLFGLFNGNALLQGNFLPDAGAGGGFDFAVGQRFQRDAAFSQLLLEDFRHRLQFVLIARRQLDGFFALQLDLRF